MSQKDKNFIKTDDNVMINISWIREIRSDGNCFQFKIENIKDMEFEVCRKNRESFQKLDEKFYFSKK